MRILFIADIFGSPGRRVLAENLPAIIADRAVDLCVGNGENVAGGIGITSNLYNKLRKYGISVITGGNHSFAHDERDPKLFECTNLLRPLNFPPGNKGRGMTIFSLGDGRSAGIINLLGRTFFSESMDCPFRTGLAAVEECRKVTPIVFIDFHAEATSEKLALAHAVDGKASAVVGTHTHVQTADERILAGGTAFISDAGMTGPEDSIIGMKKDRVINRYLLQTHVRMEPADGGPMLNAVIVDVDDTTGKASHIERIFQRISFS